MIRAISYTKRIGLDKASPSRDRKVAQKTQSPYRQIGLRLQTRSEKIEIRSKIGTARLSAIVVILGHTVILGYIDILG